MIDVRLYASLSAGSGRGGSEFQLEARPGLKVRDVVSEAGIRTEDVSVVILNDARADLDATLAEGDRLGLFPAISGG